MKKLKPASAAANVLSATKAANKEGARLLSETLAPGAEQRQDVVTIPAPSMLGIANQVAGIMDMAIRNPKLDVKKMQGIMDMQMQVLRFQAEIAYNQAMRDCQADLPHIPANKYNEHTKSKYADLDAIDTIIKPIYTKYGFSLSFDTQTLPNDNKEIICTVRHIQGHKEKHRLDGALDGVGFKGTANKTGIQAAGSSVTYLQRYLTKLIFNVVIIGEDKDGNRTTPTTTEGDAFAQRMQGDGKTIEGDKVDVVAQAGMMRADLEKLKTKKERIALINKNLTFLRSLDEAGYGDLVATMHTMADAGA